MADIVSHAIVPCDIVSHAVDIEEVSPPACLPACDIMLHHVSREGGGRGGTFMFASLATLPWQDFLHGGFPEWFGISGIKDPDVHYLFKGLS